MGSFPIVQIEYESEYFNLILHFQLNDFVWKPLRDLSQLSNKVNVAIKNLNFLNCLKMKIN